MSYTIPTDSLTTEWIQATITGDTARIQRAADAMMARRREGRTTELDRHLAQ